MHATFRRLKQVTSCNQLQCLPTTEAGPPQGDRLQ